MTKQKITTALWGLMIIILGVGALAYNFGALDDYKLITAYIVSALLVVMGAAFLLAIAFQRDSWFYVIPGFSFLSLGGVVYLSTLENIRPEWLALCFWRASRWDFSSSSCAIAGSGGGPCCKRKPSSSSPC
jgi:hypothetical protein